MGGPDIPEKAPQKIRENLISEAYNADGTLQRARLIEFLPYFDAVILSPTWFLGLVSQEKLTENSNHFLNALDQK